MDKKIFFGKARCSLELLAKGTLNSTFQREMDKQVSGKNRCHYEEQENWIIYKVLSKS